MPIAAALFDFDGTLADSFAAITASTNHVRASYSLPALTEREIREYVGFGLTNLVESLVPGADPAEAVARYRAHHETVMFSGTHLMPGVAETIAELARKGVKMAVCSNKQVQFTRELIAHLELGRYFVAVLGPEDVGGKAKPDPAMLLEGASRVGADKAETVYVGDMAIDVHAARNAGMAVWLVLGGAGGKESATEAAPDRILARFGDMLALFG